jgi:glyoxylase-like metal-dependent hydrolase (beta-lactamase superfamily II)
MQQFGVHAIRAGGVAVKLELLTRKGGDITSKLRMLASRRFSPELPIYCWLVEHEEGDFLIDTGMCAAAAGPDYLARFGPFDAWLSRRLSRFIVAPGDGLGPRLAAIRPGGAAGLRVVLTHLHSDHISGLDDLPGCDINVYQREWQHPFGAPMRLLTGVAPNCFSLAANAAAPFGAAHALTRAGDLFVVPTPGHTPHHCSVVLRRGGISFFFAGDAVYSQEQLLSRTLAGAHAQGAAASASIDRIRQFAQQEPCIFLPAHDPRAADRVLHQEVLAM